MTMTSREDRVRHHYKKPRLRFFPHIVSMGYRELLLLWILLHRQKMDHLALGPSIMEHHDFDMECLNKRLLPLTAQMDRTFFFLFIFPQSYSNLKSSYKELEESFNAGA
ncbi:hypothetical protein Q3G72_018868 [Acer saccharum]|nr:hypothetical protein Q3G72_018868 [Acer saccharum]